MEFKEKQFDGPYEVSGIDITNEGELFKGLLYFPPEKFKKPYPLIIYFHGFPQLFTLQEIIKSYQYLLDLGYAFLIFNFRGYRYSEGNVSISSQVSDGLRIMKFIEKIAENNVFDINDINILAHDFGAYIALILCSKVDLINRLLLLSPIIDLNRHVKGGGFQQILHYINQFLPGHVRGVSNIIKFIEMTKNELDKKEFQIETVLQQLRIQNLKIIIGEEDKITPLSELGIIKECIMKIDFSIIECMDHEMCNDSEIEQVNKEIKVFFTN